LYLIIFLKPKKSTINKVANTDRTIILQRKEIVVKVLLYEGQVKFRNKAVKIKAI